MLLYSWMCRYSTATLGPILFSHFSWGVLWGLQWRIPGLDTLVQPRRESYGLFQKGCSHSFLTITHLLFTSPNGRKYVLTGGLIVIHYAPCRPFYLKCTKLSYSVSQSHAQNFLCGITLCVLSAHYSTGFWLIITI